VVYAPRRKKKYTSTALFTQKRLEDEFFELLLCGVLRSSLMKFQRYATWCTHLLLYQRILAFVS
jgi:hypothetical protein